MSTYEELKQLFNEEKITYKQLKKLYEEEKQKVDEAIQVSIEEKGEIGEDELMSMTLFHCQFIIKVTRKIKQIEKETRKRVKLETIEGIVIVKKSSTSMVIDRHKQKFL